MNQLGILLAFSAGCAALAGCSSSSSPATNNPTPDGSTEAAASDDSGSGSSSSSGGGSSSSSGGTACVTAPPSYGCGAATFGASVGCTGSQVCCLAPNPSMTTDYSNCAVSTCKAPVTANGGSAQCASPSIQLCGTDAVCGAGYYCDRTKTYCIPGTAPASDGGTSEGGTSEGGTSEGGATDSGSTDAPTGG